MIQCPNNNIIFHTDCRSDLNFTQQPPQALNCNPTGVRIILYCYTSPTGPFNWYHTLDPTQAGKKGDLIVGNGNPYTLHSTLGVNSGLEFVVSNNTIGFYWCVIVDRGLSIPLRSSTVFPICMNYNSSLNQCSSNLDDQHYKVPECADANVTFSRIPLPTNCVPQPSSSSISPLNTTSHDVRSTSFLSRSTITTISTPLISSSLTTSTLLISSLSIAIQTSTSTPIPSIVSTPMPTTTNPTLNIGPSPTPSSQNLLLLYTLIGICILLAIIALIIVVAIIILCCMTRRQHSLEAATPKGTTNYV